MDYLDGVFLLLIVCFMLWSIFYAKKSSRVQDEAVFNQKEMMAPFLEQVQLAKEQNDISREQLQAIKNLIDEVQSLRNDLIKNTM